MVSTRAADAAVCPSCDFEEIIDVQQAPLVLLIFIN
jgi:hypothetical protein